MPHKSAIAHFNRLNYLFEPPASQQRVARCGTATVQNQSAGRCFSHARVRGVRSRPQYVRVMMDLTMRIAEGWSRSTSRSGADASQPLRFRNRWLRRRRHRGAQGRVDAGTATNESIGRRLGPGGRRALPSAGKVCTVEHIVPPRPRGKPASGPADAEDFIGRYYLRPMSAGLGLARPGAAAGLCGPRRARRRASPWVRRDARRRGRRRGGSGGASGRPRRRAGRLARATALVADVCAASRPADATADCVAEEGPAATLIFPEATPLGARLPKALGRRLARRLEKRGAVGPGAESGAAHRRGTGRRRLGVPRPVDDPMKTSRRRADLVVVAGGEHFAPQLPTMVRRDTAASLGAVSMSAARPTMLGGGPVYVSEEPRGLSISPVLWRRRGDAVPSARITLGAVGGGDLARGGSWKLARHPTGAPAAGAALVDGDAAAAARIVDEVTPRLVVDLGAGLSAAFIGRCDATLENRASDAGKAATVAVYVDRSDELAPHRSGAVVFVTAGAGDLAAAAEAVDDTLRLEATHP